MEMQVNAVEQKTQYLDRMAHRAREMRKQNRDLWLIGAVFGTLFLVLVCKNSAPYPWMRADDLLQVLIGMTLSSTFYGWAWAWWNAYSSQYDRMRGQIQRYLPVTSLVLGVLSHLMALSNNFRGGLILSGLYLIPGLMILLGRRRHRVNAPRVWRKMQRILRMPRRSWIPYSIRQQTVTWIFYGYAGLFGLLGGIYLFTPGYVHSSMRMATLMVTLMLPVGLIGLAWIVLTGLYVAQNKQLRMLSKKLQDDHIDIAGVRNEAGEWVTGVMVEDHLLEMVNTARTSIDHQEVNESLADVPWDTLSRDQLQEWNRTLHHCQNQLRDHLERQIRLMESLVHEYQQNKAMTPQQLRGVAEPLIPRLQQYYTQYRQCREKLKQLRQYI